MNAAAVADPDTGERRRLTVEGLVDQLVWWLKGSGATPPPSVAALPEDEQRRIWLHIESLARRSGAAAIQALLDGLVSQNQPHQTTTLNGPGGPAGP